MTTLRNDAVTGGGAARHGDGQPVRNLEDVPRRRAAQTPDLIAVQTETDSTTFGELDALASRVAQALLALGLAATDRVAYVGENSPELLAVLYGASKMGAVPTALNTRLAPGEYDYILRDSEPAVVVLGRGHEQLTPVAAAVASVRAVVCLRPEAGSDAIAYDTWVGEADPVDPGYVRDPAETALIFYSSGTTGRPKGVELTGDNVGHGMGPLSALVELEVGSVATAPVPFFHVAGLTLAVTCTLNGSTLLLRNPTDPADLARLLLEERVSHAVVVPTLLQRLLQVPGVAGADWSRLRYVIYGSSPIPRPVIEEATRVLGCRFVQSYGLTETTGGVTVLTGEDHHSPDPARLRSAGRVADGVELMIVDPETGTPVPTGDRGEILVRGPMVMKGYWRNPDATAQVLSPHGWFRTGDGGSLDDAGYLYLHDRLKDMIVSGGENVYPAEVESAMTGHPEVAQVAVVGVPSERWGEAPLAVVVRVPGSELAEDDLIAWTRERLAHYKCPASVVFVDALPLNASGKLLKYELRARYA